VNCPAPEWTRRYEALRAHAIGEALLDLVPLGLALLWHRGVAGWMTAECSATEVFAAAERVGRARPGALGSRRCELVRLLAGSALFVARERAS
jgi:hypothetical protein